jgi:transcriptional regulator with GAF, ATPase, and Fis domain
MDTLGTRGNGSRAGTARAEAAGAAGTAHGHHTPGAATVPGEPDTRSPFARTDEAGFYRLIADISARFANVPAVEMAATVDASLRMCTAALDMDRGTILHTAASGGTLTVRSDCGRPGVSILPSGSVANAHFPVLSSAVRSGEFAAYPNLEAAAGDSDREAVRRLDAKAGLTLPLRARGRLVGALCFTDHRRDPIWGPEVIERARLVASVIGGAMAIETSQTEQQDTLSEVQRIRVRLDDEAVRVPGDGELQRVHRRLASDSAVIRRALAQAEQVAPTPATVLLAGETGTGKEVFAQTIHDLSPRHKRPMVRVNCGAIPAALIESELFGRERGAYTGALSRQAGRFELAEGSTVFLDEVGELPLEAQVKLLRVLQEREVERLGGSRPIKVDVRVIAASNKDLERCVAERTFREDLFYRLNVFPIIVPPLRERVADIPVLIWTFIDEYSKAFGKPISSVSKESLAALQQYAWPGNVRELRNTIERAVITATGPHLTVDVPRPSAASRRRSVKLADVEVEHIRSVLDETGWRVRGPNGAAALLGLKPTTLESRLARLGLKRKLSMGGGGAATMIAG